MTRYVLALWIVLGLVSSVAPLPALAAGGGGGGGGGAGGGSDERLSSKPVDPDYTAAVKSIKAGQYPAAIRLLEGVVARDATNADAYNWLAYATRKNGDPARAIPIYEKALAIDPDHRGAHEYIGEAYLQLDNLGKAKEHLAKLDRLCFFSCSEYRDLKKAVNSYEKSHSQTKPSAAK